MLQTQGQRLELDAVFGAATSTGRTKQQLRASLAGEVEEGDLINAATVEAGIKPLQLKTIRQSHHNLARLMAQGIKPAEISEILGISPSRQSILKDDPTFKELLQHYTGLEDEQQLRSRADFHDRLAALGFDSIELLHERILEQPDSFTGAELTKIIETIADRTGHGKTQTVNTNNVNVSLTPEELQRIRSGAAAGQTNPALPSDRGALLRLAVRATESLPGREEVSGSESEGSGLREEGHQGAEAPAGGDQLPSVD